jgi:hypothetical protein
MTAPDTIVLIPTANRPAYLETALASVAGQSARHRIKEVRVMENGGERRSEEVCERYSNRLPIRYVFRDPPLPVLDHGRTIMEEIYPGRFVAVLHDDDWWAPEHLGSSLRALEESSAVACYSAHFSIQSEAAPAQWHDSLMFWAGSGYQPLTGDWLLDMAGVLVANLGGSPAHYSTIVADAEAYRKCADTHSVGNEFDSDRMVCVGFARYGKVVFRPVPTVFIRVHPEQDTRRFDEQKRNEGLFQTTVWMFSIAQQARIDLMTEFQRCLEMCPVEHRFVVFIQFTKPWLFALARKHPRMPRVLLEFWNGLQTRSQAGPARAA